MAFTRKRVRISVRFGALLLAFAILLANTAIVCSREDEGFLVGADEDDAPIRVLSDRMEADTEEKWIEFIGNVRATQNNSVIEAERLKVYYISGESAESDSIRKIVAEGNVRITSETKRATADHAIYSADNQELVLTGNSNLWSEENVVRGDKITVFMDKDQSIVEGDDGKQVEAEFYPKKRGGIQK